MRKEILLNYIAGKATPQEEASILLWLEQSSQNRDYFYLLNNLWAANTLSSKRATQEELDNIRRLTTAKESRSGNNLNNKREDRRLFFKKIVRYSAAALLLLSASINFLLYKQSVEYSKPTPLTLDYLPSAYKHEIYTENGVKAKVTLPDSTHVILNSGSRLIYPDRFEGATREIAFSGEAYFQVESDSTRPFIVRTNKDFKVEVLGTSFNLKSYDNDAIATTTLVSGALNVISEVSIPLRNKEKKREVITRLKPRESCVISVNKPPLHIRAAEVESKTAWKDGWLIFNSAPMDEVIKMLERWHGVNFIVKDPAIYGYDITARFKTESIVQIMEMIKYCALVDYTITDDNTISLFGRSI